MKANFKEFLKKIDFDDPSEYDFDKDVLVQSNFDIVILKNQIFAFLDTFDNAQ